MAALTLDAVAATGCRFSSAVGTDDPAALVASVRRGIFQAYKGQLYEEVQRLRAIIAFGSDAVLAATLCVISIALANVGATVAEADAALRLWGLTAEVDWWPYCRDGINDSVHRVSLILAATQRYPPERGRKHGQLLLAGLHIIGECASNWDRYWGLASWPAGRNQTASASSASVDGLALGIQVVQLSSSSSSPE